MQLFLCSYFAGAASLFSSAIQPSIHNKEVLFIPTAANIEEYNGYVQEAKVAFERLGLQVKLFDIAKVNEDEAREKINNAEILYISGGNSFYLLSELKKKNLLSLIRSRISSGLIYIGESAGAIIASPNISYASIMDDVVFGSNLKSFTSLAVIDFYVLPHYGEFPFEKLVQETLNIYEKSLNLIPINNSEAIIVNNDEYKILGR